MFYLFLSRSILFFLICNLVLGLGFGYAGKSVYKDVGFPLDCVLFLSSLHNNLYTILYLVVQEHTLSTVAQTSPLACLRTLDSGLAQVVCLHLDPAGLARFPCTRTSKTPVCATLSPSSLLTLVPIPGMTLALNTKSLPNVQVRVRNTLLRQPTVSATPSCLTKQPPLAPLQGHKSHEQIPQPKPPLLRKLGGHSMHLSE